MQTVPRITRPPIGTPLDRPFVKPDDGLMFFAPFWEGQNGKVVRDIVVQQQRCGD